jgi:hypothetical protein
LIEINRWRWEHDPNIGETVGTEEQKYNLLKFVAAHEFGHVLLGPVHAAGTKNVMNVEVSLFHLISENDLGRGDLKLAAAAKLPLRPRPLDKCPGY